MGSPHKKIICSIPEHENFCDLEPYDWFSNLPDHILHHILSLVDMTDVMKTSLLARRWRYIWVSVPCLKFELKEFWRKRKRLSYGECLSKFWLFVMWAILIRKATTIYEVRCVCDYFDDYQLELILFLCALRNVPELYVSAGYEVQLCPFYCALPENAEASRKNIRRMLDLKPLTGLWNFKTLHLVGVRFPDADITERLFGDGALLENLSIESCSFLMIKLLKISAKKLRKLNFVNFSITLYGHKYTFDGELELHTPNLESFCYMGPAIRFSESADMPYLKNASVLHQRIFHPRVPSKHLCSLISAIHHVENLSLSAYFLQYIYTLIRTSRPKFTPLDYLRCLKVDLECNSICFEGLIDVLQYCPNLETIRIQLNQGRYGDARSSNGSKRKREEEEIWLISPWGFRRDVPCLSHTVKEIEIEEFYDWPGWFELIAFFLQYGKSLERIKILHKRKKVNLEKFYALQKVRLACEAVSVSIAFTSAFGKKGLIQLVYGNSGLSVQTKTSKMKIKIRRSKRNRDYGVWMLNETKDCQKKYSV